MKRLNSEGESPRRSPWQQPASCISCRQKKIRCDRKRACSNCTIREISCQYAPSETNAELARNRLADGYGSRRISSVERNVTIHDQVNTVEHFSHGGYPPVNPNSKSPPQRNEQALGDDSLEEDTNGVWAHLEEISSTPRTEDEEVRQRHSAIAAGYPISGQPAPHHARNANAADGGIADYEDMSKLLVQLPNIYTARLLLQHYIETLDILHRELHVPSTRAFLETTYTQLSNSRPVSWETLAFFFSIFASSAFHICQGRSHSRCKALQSTTASYAIWKGIATNLLLYKELLVSKTVLSLQATCILIYLVWDSEGQSPLYNNLRSIAHTKAFQMKIHRLDAENTRLDEDIIQVEIKRRLWWCLASTDWIVASVPGPQEGIFTLNPKQFRVNYPSNLDDEDLQPGMGPVEGRPENEPTSMSFVISKAQFSQVCREVLDCIQESEFSINPTNHELAMHLSHRYQAALDALPWFLRPGEDTGSEMTALLEQRPYIFRQKHVLLHAAYSRMGRLHRPFLARSMQDPRFASSRAVAITCATEQIKFCHMTEPGDLCPYILSHSIDQHLFGGLVLLSVDIMVHRDETGVDSRIRELMDTTAMIKRKQQKLNPSNAGVVFAIDKLMDILQTRCQSRPSQASGETHPEARPDAEKVVSRTMEPTKGLQANKKEIDHADNADDAFLQAFMNQDTEKLWVELLNGFSYEDIFNVPSVM